MVIQHAVLAFCIAAVLAPFSYYAGLGARALRLPQITGYLLSGIVVGPYVFGILTVETVSDLSILEGACLAIIGLAAGAELDLPSLARSGKQVFSITAGICLSSWVLCYGAFAFVARFFQVLPESSRGVGHIVALASLGATLMMARSPASAIAVLKEMNGKGPFSSLVMAVVVVKDMVVIVGFALNLELIRAVLAPGLEGPSHLQVANMILPILSVLLSMAMGAFGGGVLRAALRPRVAVQVLPVANLPARFMASARTKMALMLVTSTLIFQAAHRFDAEPLLACVTMGLVLTNFRRQAGERGDRDREEMLSLIAAIMAVTNVAFFGLAGASLKLSSIRYMLIPALLVAGVRLAAIGLGSWLGCTASNTPHELRRVFWASMVTQAGVALGLARLAGARFPDWGPHFQTFMVAIIVINLLVGPPLFRWSLLVVGEARHQTNVVRASSTNVPTGHGGAKAALELADVVVDAAGGGDKQQGEAKASHSL